MRLVVPSSFSVTVRVSPASTSSTEYEMVKPLDLVPRLAALEVVMVGVVLLSTVRLVDVV